jgi:hypothetical protein
MLIVPAAVLPRDLLGFELVRQLLSWPVALVAGSQSLDVVASLLEQ